MCMGNKVHLNPRVPLLAKKYCWKNDIPSNVWNQTNNTTYWTNFLRPSTLLLCKKIIYWWKNTEKWALSFFIGDLCHQILPRTHSNLCARGKICDINLHWKMTKFIFLYFFNKKYFFYVKAKLTVSNSLSSTLCYFFDSTHLKGCLFFSSIF